MKKLAIALMVKDESEIIERCLTSCLKIYPDLIIVTDTGSTDDTILKIATFLQKYIIPFKIYKEKFVDFAHNRTLLLQKAKMANIDYVLMLDADETIETENNFYPNVFKNQLFHDLYDIILSDGHISFHLPRLTSNTKDIYYRGVTHEYLEEQGLDKSFNSSVKIHCHNDSSRRIKNQKFDNDVFLLEKALKETVDEKLKARYMFYLAQSYYSLKKMPEAIEAYQKRTLMKGWEEEIFYSYYQIGNIIAATYPQSIDTITINYLLAYEVCPYRIESLVALKKVWQNSNLSNLPNLLTLIIQKTPKPISGLFLENEVYV